SAFVVKRVRIEPKVPRVDDTPYRRVEHYNSTTRYRVGHPYQLHKKLPDFEPFMGIFVHGNGFELKPVRHGQAKITKDFLNPTNGKFTAVNRRWKTRHNVWQRTNMVQMSMSDDVGAKFGFDTF